VCVCETNVHARLLIVAVAPLAPKFAPWIVTVLRPSAGPLAGLTLVTVGAA
jgi:hypothetical protein